MTAASRATIVIGCPSAGPTCSAVTRLRLQPLAGSLPLESPWSVLLRGALIAAVRLATTPDGPDDARDLVGDSDGSLVVHVGLCELVGPLAESIGLLLARVQQRGARAVDE